MKIKTVFSRLLQPLTIATRNMTHTSSTGSKNFLFRQLFDNTSCTYTYLLGDADNKECILIDPVVEHAKRDFQLVKDLNLNLIYAEDQENLQDRLSTVENALDSLRQNLSILEKQEYLEDKLATVVNALGGLKNNVTLLEDQENLEDRVSTVENALDKDQENLEDRVSTVENALDSLRYNLSVLDNQENLEDRVSTVEIALDSLR
ncbi:unnamed protein product [Psylliodes chrysocephalus]|uniref:Uncharacterized protein n=1 Tax=Psylliodes chrysocephalus TaxID=3402493 RepID=A0A9P0CK75_9CUCU|nr:unnamed protein product [Psylliodes chrysocephala]